MKEKKQKCKHHKIPIYNDEEQKTVAWLIQEIKDGNINCYSLLTRLAVKVAEEGRFRRETCQDCE